jgi:hypothetical protein
MVIPASVPKFFSSRIRIHKRFHLELYIKEGFKINLIFFLQELFLIVIDFHIAFIFTSLFTSEIRILIAVIIVLIIVFYNQV